MHMVAMSRKRLHFANGALALNGVKLAFQLDKDNETPKLCVPYPIKDSNRLIEEYMLMANYLVAQRLLAHAGGLVMIRNHAPLLEKGMEVVVDMTKENCDFDIDTTSSKMLQESLSRLGQECTDALVLQCVTECLMTPMRPAEYMAVGEVDEEDWKHFALNIPYYTYPDVVVYRLLQATLDSEGSSRTSGGNTIEDFPLSQKEIQDAAGHCNKKRMASKKASERIDRVFLSLFLKKNPLTSTLRVCLGVG